MLFSRAHRCRNTSIPRPPPPMALTSESSRTTIWASVSEVTTLRNSYAESLCTILPSHSTTVSSPILSTVTFSMAKLEHGQYRSFILCMLDHCFRVGAGISRRNEHIWPTATAKSPRLQTEEKTPAVGLGLMGFGLVGHSALTSLAMCLTEVT